MPNARKNLYNAAKVRPEAGNTLLKHTRGEALIVPPWRGQANTHVPFAVRRSQIQLQ